VVRFWLDRGVDGFRLDTINFYFHDKELRDNPRSIRRRNDHRARVNPYNWQDHVYSKNQPENLEFLRRFRALLDEYPAAPRWARSATRSAGSRSWPSTPAGGDKVHMCYSFEFLSGIAPTPAVGAGRGHRSRRPSATAGPAGRFPTTT
jgi:alpha-glucosidase